ncbi:MAG: nucleotidyltransferase family protein [Flavobacteriales bacterium]|nr:nucleotidyltransferase family protein [Flavobacteriales bacterium]
MSNIDLEVKLIDLIERHSFLPDLLRFIEKLDLPQWYIGAGIITQTVWNVEHGFPLLQNIQDLDLIYYDDGELWDQKELQSQITIEFPGIEMEIDVVNQATVHHWYEQTFGFEISKYQSSNEAIKTWPTTSNAVGIRVKQGQYEVYAPFGLEDLFNLILRPNKKMITKDIYYKKVHRWTSCWPKLSVIEW